jgi:hypothetical protein
LTLSGTHYLFHFRAALLKRLLLQTPLIYWPAILVPGISTSFENDDKLKTSAEVVQTPFELYIDCESTHFKGGYKTLLLWEKLLKPKAISFALEDVLSGKKHRLTLSTSRIPSP